LSGFVFAMSSLSSSLPWRYPYPRTGQATPRVRAALEVNFRRGIKHG
jgi:hypothetical protein